MMYPTALPKMRQAAVCAPLGLCLTAGLLPRAEALASSAAFPVTHTADDLLPGSLVVFQIPASDPGVSSATGAAKITLALGTVVVSTASSVSIAGGNAPSGAVIVDGAGQSRVFSVMAGTVTFSGLTIQNGVTQFSPSDTRGGGGILNTAALTLTNCLVTANSSNAIGGASTMMGPAPV